MNAEILTTRQIFNIFHDMVDSHQHYLWLRNARDKRADQAFSAYWEEERVLFDFLLARSEHSPDTTKKASRTARHIDNDPENEVIFSGQVFEPYSFIWGSVLLVALPYVGEFSQGHSCVKYRYLEIDTETGSETDIGELFYN